MKGIVAALCIILPLWLTAQRTQTSLNGTWTFAIDPVKVGAADRWFDTTFARRAASFDKVTVPHCFMVDPRYAFYTGTAWYFKSFNAVVPAGHRAFLHFDAVFYKARIWLNGALVGRHEGGYTAFELDVTAMISNRNVLAVEVDNSWDTTTIPGAKTKVDYESPNAAQLYAWINYGGITRPVQLITRPAVYIQNSQVMADPDLKNGTASIRIKSYIKNCSDASLRTEATAAVFYQGIKSNLAFKPVQVALEPGVATSVEWIALLPAAEVKLWNQDEPHLYTAEIVVAKDTFATRFGIRSVKVQGTQLLLNGVPVRMGGCNRPLDYPGFGSIDPQQVLEKDLRLIKSGCMELSRISHYPVSERLLNWADEHGLFIIAEAGNWQMTPAQMIDTMMRSKFRSQFQEMIEEDLNHPSVIAYSLGNEFQSQTEAGKAWVRDMRQFARNLDSSRLITFASHILRRGSIVKPEEEASQYVDFISFNVYADHLKAIRHVHEIYPDKPIYISEFGQRADGVGSEVERISYLKNAMAAFRQCDYVIGASIWTFNDYQSRFPGTNPNGYRPWGLVTPERTTRDMYTAWQEEMAPAMIVLLKPQMGKAILRLTTRKDFPAYPLKGYQLECNGQSLSVNYLLPGESQEWAIDLPAGKVTIELIKPGGYIILSKTLQ